jgi:hypothetical protein
VLVSVDVAQFPGQSRADFYSRTRRQEAPAAQDQAKVTITKFQVKNVSWHELIGHCRTEHPKTCQELEKLGPSQIAEMKQRVMSGDRSIPRG